MKKSMMIVSMICAGMLSMTGCMNAIPEMDEASREMIIEYAAATVRKYDTNHTNRLEEVQEETEAEAEGMMEEAPVGSEEMPAATEDASYAEETKQEESALKPDESVEIIEIGEEEETVTEPVSLEEVLQLNNATLSYRGYEINQEYPKSGEELYFTMSATEGNQLLIIKYNLKNLEQAEQNIDLVNKSIRFKIVINGESKNALTTMLLNDLSNFQGTLMQGEEKEVVLICEISQEQMMQIDTLDLIVKNGDATSTISLK